MSAQSAAPRAIRGSGLFKERGAQACSGSATTASWAKAGRADSGRPARAACGSDRRRSSRRGGASRTPSRSAVVGSRAPRRDRVRARDPVIAAYWRRHRSPGGPPVGRGWSAPRDTRSDPAAAVWKCHAPDAVYPPTKSRAATSSMSTSLGLSVRKRRQIPGKPGAKLGRAVRLVTSNQQVGGLLEPSERARDVGGAWAAGTRAAEGRGAGSASGARAAGGYGVAGGRGATRGRALGGAGGPLAGGFDGRRSVGHPPEHRPDREHGFDYARIYWSPWVSKESEFRLS